MGDYELDPDNIFSDDQVAAPVEGESSGPAPQKRPRPPARNGGSALDALDSLDLSSFKGGNGFGGGYRGRGRGSYGGNSRGGYRGRSNDNRGGGYGGRSGGRQGANYGGRTGGYGGRSGGHDGGYGGRAGGYDGGYDGRSRGYGGRSGGYADRSAGAENGIALGDHMRAGAPAPAKGRPGIHPSRLAQIAQQEPVVSEEPKFLSREQQRDAAFSILSEADRQKLIAQEAENRPKRKRPGRRAPRSSASRRDDAELTWEEEQEAKREAELRSRRSAASNRKGFNLMEAMKVVGSGNPSSTNKRREQQEVSVAATKRRRRSAPPSDSAYMRAILGEEGMKRKSEKERREREEREAEILWMRSEAKQEREKLLQRWKNMGTEASRRRNTINLMLYEDGVLFATREERKRRFNMESFGLERKSWKASATEEELKRVEEICFVAVSDDI